MVRGDFGPANGFDTGRMHIETGWRIYAGFWVATCQRGSAGPSEKSSVFIASPGHIGGKLPRRFCITCVEIARPFANAIDQLLLEDK